MTNEALISFLQEHGAKLADIEQITQQLSPQAMQKLYLKTNRSISLAQADLVASIERDKFVEIIKNDQKGAILWDLVKRQLG
jgi:hypothetical protein